MYEEVFRRIMQASQNNSLTFFVGAGISKLSGAPGWSELIDDICLEMGKTPKGDGYTSDELLQIPQMYYYSINQDDNRYYSLLEKIINKTTLHPNKIHKKLLQFNPSSFITTNFDDLLEDAAIMNAQGFKSIADNNEIPTINGDRYILKLHGDLKHKNIVFKEEDYLNYSERFKLIETVLKAVFSMNTVVFIGYSLNDYNIKLVLNWTKTLLKDQFNEPIFIHTGHEYLSKEELIYQKSKGVKVVECKRCWPDLSKSTEYIERYNYILDVIYKSAHFVIDGKNEESAFEALYELLLPLNSMNALRIQDVQEKLEKNVRIWEEGVILIDSINPSILLKKYCEINNLSEVERNSLPLSVRKKYHTISSVFVKAGITKLKSDRIYIKISGASCEFADVNCIEFDYCKMYKFCAVKSKNRYEKYKKAYYLERLNKYEKAYWEFWNVAHEAFREKDYLLYYLAQVNCNKLYKVLTYVSRYISCDMEKIKSSSLTEEQMSQVFDKLPIEFKNAYASLKDLNTTDLLYKYSYDSFATGKKLQEAIDSNALEMGLSSSEKVRIRIRGYLHFLIGNGICADYFGEFKSSIIHLMNSMLYKFSTQNKSRILKNFMPCFEREKIEFNHVDFFCFVEYFDSKTLIKELSKYDIDSIEFDNMDTIIKCVSNMIEYYEKILIKKGDHIQKLKFQEQFKTCLVLLRYMDLSQDIVDNICRFIFKYEFREILLSDKLAFLQWQIYQKKKYSDVTAKIIENKLIYYIDKHIKAVENNTNFDTSFQGNMEYCYLAKYILPELEYCSRRLSARVSKILKLNNKILNMHVVKCYWGYVSEYQKKQIANWLKASIEKKFDFKLLCWAIEYNIPIGDNILDRLYNYLCDEIEQHKKETDSKALTMILYPEEDFIKDLEQVGWWILLGIIKKDKFTDFVGTSAQFDFCYLYEDFDFSKFNVSWLFAVTEEIRRQISKSKTVKRKVRMEIARCLKERSLSSEDEKKLTQILAKHFC